MGQGWDTSGASHLHLGSFQTAEQVSDGGHWALMFLQGISVVCAAIGGVEGTDQGVALDLLPPCSKPTSRAKGQIQQYLWLISDRTN